MAEIWCGGVWEDLEAGEDWSPERFAVWQAAGRVCTTTQLLEAGADGISARSAHAARAARREADRFEAKVIGTIGPTEEFLSLTGNGMAARRRLLERYRVLVVDLVESGVDVLHLDQGMDMENLRVGLEAVRSVGAGKPVAITARIEAMGTMLDGTSPERFLEFARGCKAEIVGLSGDRPAIVGAWKMGFDAVFLHCVWPAAWPPVRLETPETFADLLGGMAESGRVKVVGSGTWQKAGYVAALRGRLGRG